MSGTLRPVSANTSKRGRLYMADIGEVKVNVNVSEAIAGLKALQREARKATAALAELKAAADALKGGGADE